MATAQATRVAEVTETASLALMQNMMRVSLSEICWLRNLFPSDVFKDAKFGSTQVKFLNAKGADGSIRSKEAAELVACLEAALEALELRYLQSMGALNEAPSRRCRQLTRAARPHFLIIAVLAVYSADEDKSQRRLLESYVFDVS